MRSTTFTPATREAAGSSPWSRRPTTQQRYDEQVRRRIAPSARQVFAANQQRRAQLAAEDKPFLNRIVDEVWL